MDTSLINRIERRGLLWWGVADKLGSNLQEGVRGIAAHIDFGIGQGLGESRNRVGVPRAEIARDGRNGNLGQALSVEQNVDFQQRRLRVGHAEEDGCAACCCGDGFAILRNLPKSPLGSHAGWVLRVCSSLKKERQSVCTQAAQGHGGPVGGEQALGVIHDLAKLVEGWHGSYPEGLKTEIGCVCQFVRSPVGYPFVVELVARERQAKSGSPSGEHRFPSRVLVLEPFKEEWEGRHPNMGDSVCCLLEFGSLDLVFGELGHPGANSASLVVWFEAAIDEQHDLGHDEGSSCEARSYAKSSFSSRRHGNRMMDLSYG